MLNYLHLYTLKIIWTIDFVVISISLKYESINHFDLFLSFKNSFHPAYIIEKEIEQYIYIYVYSLSNKYRTQYTQNLSIELNLES